jgi:hypothetical protein
MVKRSNNNNKRKVITKMADPSFAPKRLKLSGRDIPSYTPAPPVTRVVRFVSILTSAFTVNSITYKVIAEQDALNYIGLTTPRYSQMRLKSVKCYAESPNSLSVSQSPYGLVVKDSFTNVQFVDKPVTGARVAAVGFIFPFYVRSIFIPTSSTTIHTIISCDTSIAASTNYVVTSDFEVEFLA